MQKKYDPVEFNLDLTAGAQAEWGLSPPRNGAALDQAQVICEHVQFRY